MTQPIRLHAIATANSQRVAIMLEELELPYEVALLDRSVGEQHTPAFRAINPTGMVPVIVDPQGPGGQPLTLAQSGAILLYLAEKQGRLLPADAAARAHTLQWFMHTMSDLFGTGAALFFSKMRVAAPDAATVALFEARMGVFLRDCDRALAGQEWLAGAFSVADVALYPLVAPRRAGLAEMPALAAWAERMAARGAVARGMQAVA